MNEGLQNRLSEVVGANNVAYILKDNSEFSLTGYKVMQNQSNAGLLRCAKIMYNGKIKLVYILDGNKPLSYVATRLGVNELNAVIFNLIQRAMDIKANGFFKAENLELDFNKIFVDTADYSVHLIYFPLSGGSTGKISAFENEFRIALINLFNSFPVFNAPQFQRLCSDLANGSLPLDVILKKLQDNVNNAYGSKLNGVEYGRKQAYGNAGWNSKNSQMEVNDNFRRAQYASPDRYGNVENNDFRSQNEFSGAQLNRNEYVARQPVLTVTAINSPVQLVLTVNQPEYLIGKNPNMVNGAVTHNPAISRVHCKIFFDSGRYFITDLDSANGTYVNQRRLGARETAEINNGDYIRLANSDFIISF